MPVAAVTDELVSPPAPPHESPEKKVLRKSRNGTTGSNGSPICGGCEGAGEGEGAHWPHSTRVDAMPRPSPSSGADKQAPSATGDELGQLEHVRSVQNET